MKVLKIFEDLPHLRIALLHHATRKKLPPIISDKYDLFFEKCIKNEENNDWHKMINSLGSWSTISLSIRKDCNNTLVDLARFADIIKDEGKNAKMFLLLNEQFSKYYMLEKTNKDVLEDICKQFNIPLKNIELPDYSQKTCLIRNIIIYKFYKESNVSLKYISNMLNKKYDVVKESYKDVCNNIEKYNQTLEIAKQFNFKPINNEKDNI